MDKKQDILSDNEVFEKDAPLLHSISKENPFTVPEDYFDMLPSQIIERCRTGNRERKTSVIIENLKLFVLGYKWRVLTITGCVAILCFFGIRMNNNRPQSYQAMVQNIPDSLIVANLDKNVTDINMSALEDISAETQENSTPASAKTGSDSTSTDQDMIAYLMNNNVTVSDIENE